MGCGALPLTGILLALAKPKGPIYCVDRDPSASEKAQGLVDLWGLEKHIKIISQDASRVQFPDESIVVCASLLRASSLYEQLFKSRVDHVVVRDAEFPYTFLYQSAVLPQKKLYRQVSKTSVCAQRVNTSRLFQRVGACL